MSQNAERAKIIKHIRALSEQTMERGQSEAAANMAMERIAKLLTTYNLTMDEVMLGAENCVKVSVSTGFTKRRPIDSVITDIAHFVDCRTWFSKECTKVKLDAKGQPSYYRNARGRTMTHKVPGDSKYYFFGFESDALMAQHLFEIIRDAIDYELNQFKASDVYVKSADKLSLSNSFGRAMAARVGRRLNDMKATMEREVRDQRTTGSDLVVVKKNRVEDEFKKSGVRLRSSGGYQGARHNAGSAAGREAGDRVNLNRPLGGGREQLLLG